MKKKITFLAAALLFALISQAQILKKGNAIIDAYYGFPNMYGSFLQSFYTDDGDLDVSVGMIGPVGGKIEYLLSDKVGLGINGWHSNAWLNGTVP